MRSMGLDVGDVRIGVAVSDALGITAQGVATVARQPKEGDINEILKLIDEYEVTQLVVGLPKNMNGTLGPQAEKVKDFMARLLAKKELPLRYWDERLTTVSAEKTLIAGNMSRAKRKKVVDKMAAAIILQGYLDSSVR